MADLKLSVKAQFAALRLTLTLEAKHETIELEEKKQNVYFSGNFPKKPLTNNSTFGSSSQLVIAVKEESLAICQS